MEECETLDFMWGDCGTAHVTICPKCKEFMLGWACCWKYCVVSTRFSSIFTSINKCPTLHRLVCDVSKHEVYWYLTCGGAFSWRDKWRALSSKRGDRGAEVLGCFPAANTGEEKNLVMTGKKGNRGRKGSGWPIEERKVLFFLYFPKKIYCLCSRCPRDRPTEASTEWGGGGRIGFMQ